MVGHDAPNMPEPQRSHLLEAALRIVFDEAAFGKGCPECEAYRLKIGELLDEIATLKGDR